MTARSSHLAVLLRAELSAGPLGDVCWRRSALVSLPYPSAHWAPIWRLSLPTQKPPHLR